jgi:hypothetical protein
LNGLRYLAKGSTIVVLDQDLRTAKHILGAFPLSEFKVLIIERSRTVYDLTLKQIVAAKLSESVTCVFGDLFSVLASDTRPVHALWIDSMASDICRDDLQRLCEAHKELTFVAVTITMRAHYRTFKQRIKDMDDALRSYGLGCYLAWGYRMTGGKSSSMGLVCFDRKNGKGGFDPMKILYRPRSAVSLGGGKWLVHWWGFPNDPSVENSRTASLCEPY